MRRCHTVLALGLALIVLSARLSLAQDRGMEPPIIALANNNLYTVSPADGSARLLVERAVATDDALREIDVNPALRLGPVSPDNATLAYLVPEEDLLSLVLANRIEQIAPIGPTDIVLVDIPTGDQMVITDQGRDFVQSAAQGVVKDYSRPTWSDDGQRLYFVTETWHTLERENGPQESIAYYDRLSGDIHELAASLDTSLQFGLYAVPAGLIVLDALDNNGNFRFMLYGEDDSVINTLEMPLSDTMGYVNGTMLSMNPIHTSDVDGFGYYTFETGELIPNVLDVASGEVHSLEDELYPAVISHAAPETSLRLALSEFFPGEDSLWDLTDAEGNGLGSLPFDNSLILSEIALSPGGELAAYLQDGQIVVTDGNETRELGFTADAIVWGPTTFTFTPVRYRG